jgi:hypothetical protein
VSDTAPSTQPGSGSGSAGGVLAIITSVPWFARPPGVDTRSLVKIVARTGPDTPTVLKGPLSVPQRMTWTTPMSVDDVKQIGRPTDATVNDVALATPRRQFCVEVY